MARSACAIWISAAAGERGVFLGCLGQAGVLLGQFLRQDLNLGAQGLDPGGVGAGIGQLSVERQLLFLKLQFDVADELANIGDLALGVEDRALLQLDQPALGGAAFILGLLQGGFGGFHGIEAFFPAERIDAFFGVFDQLFGELWLVSGSAVATSSRITPSVGS